MKKTIINWNEDLTSAPRNQEVLVLGMHWCISGYFITTALYCNPNGNVWVSGERQLTGVVAWAPAQVDDLD